MVEIDGIEHPVKKGSVVYIPGYAEHGLRNHSTTDELVWLYVFAADDFEEVHYRFRHESDVSGEVRVAPLSSKL